MPGLSGPVPLIFTATVCAVSLWLVDAQAGGLGGAAGDVQDLQSCSCDCCKVVYRSPAEIDNPEKDSNVKCATRDESPSTGNTCPATCRLGLKAKVLQMGETGAVQYSQFCFRECKPYDVEPGHDCWRISMKEAKQAKTKDKNGKDVNYIPVVMMPPTKPPPPAPPLAVPTVTEQPMAIAPAPPPPTAAEAIIHEASSASHTATEAAATIGASGAEAEKWAKLAEERALKARAVVKAWNERNPLQLGSGSSFLQIDLN